MDLSQKFKNHVGKREAVAKVTRELEYIRLSFVTDVKPLRDEFLHLQSLCEEIVAAVKILLETDVQIVDSQIRAEKCGEAGDEWGKLREQGSALTGEAWTRMSLSWKIFLYSVRCFQDSVYKAILHAQGQQAGPQASMSKCISDNVWRDDTTVGKLIAMHLPSYPNWFIRTRKLRNELKRGLSVESVWRGRKPEHFIVLCERRWNGCMIEKTAEHPLKLEFATESIKMCMAVVPMIQIASEETRERKHARSLRMKK